MEASRCVCFQTVISIAWYARRAESTEVDLSSTKPCTSAAKRSR